MNNRIPLILKISQFAVVSEVVFIAYHFVIIEVTALEDVLS